ncbi:MAG: stalk domain-containing protein [Pelotomaculum sp.]
MFKLQKTIYIFIGVLIGILISSTFALANNPIRIFLNGNELQNVNAILISDTTYLPVRAISEALGLNVEWDDASRSVIITTNKNTALDKNESTNANEDKQRFSVPREQIKVTKFNDIDAIEYNNQIYFSIIKYVLKSNTQIQYHTDNNDNILTLDIKYPNGEKITINNTPNDMIRYDYFVYVNSKYYKKY